MANGWGGARTPSTPAPVSAPGALSSRTDGGVLNPKEPAYGERQVLENLTAAAPMATGGGQAPSGGSGARVPTLPAFGAPTADPNTPVTNGAAAGPGEGLAALGLPQTPSEMTRADVAALPPGQIQALIAAAQEPDATPSFRLMVRKILYS